MKDIQMVDLNNQYLKIKLEVDNEINKVINNSSFINGPVVKEFQNDLKKYLGVKHIITCGNGTDALQVSMMALGLKPGDEVITTTFTFIATAEVIALLGLTPVLVDVDEKTFNIDPKKIEKAISPKTKAIVPVHLFGQAAPMEEILDIAKKHNLFIIEDNAQAIGSDYTYKNGTSQKAGTIGDLGCTSFFPSKNLGAYGDGGAVFTNDDKLAEDLQAIVNHGMKTKYYHDFIGVNSRLDSIQAAVLKVKLKHLDDYAKARLKAADYYDEKLKDIKGIITPFRYEKSTHVFHQYTLKVDGIDRFKLMDCMKSKGIPVAIYYPVPLHQQKAYRSERYNDGDFPISEKLSESVISLPMHTELTPLQQDYIIDNLISFINNEK